MNRFSLDPTFLWEQYEALRTEALEAEPLGRRGQGLTIFISRGMIAWMDALNALGRRPRAALEDRSSQYLDLPAAVRSDLTVVLADMVLSCHGEAGR